MKGKSFSCYMVKDEGHERVPLVYVNGSTWTKHLLIHLFLRKLFATGKFFSLGFSNTPLGAMNSIYTANAAFSKTPANPSTSLEELIAPARHLKGSSAA